MSETLQSLLNALQAAGRLTDLERLEILTASGKEVLDQMEVDSRRFEEMTRLNAEANQQIRERDALLADAMETVSRLNAEADAQHKELMKWRMGN